MFPNELIRDLENLLKGVVRNKIQNYTPETEYKPFHHRLIGKDHYAMFSFIHSMNTTFGMGIFEQMGELIANNYGHQASRSHKLKGQIDTETEKLINSIHHNLRQGSTEPDVFDTTETIRKSIKPMEPVDDPDKTVDLFVREGVQENYFDITSAKPNMKEFSALKRKLLRWVGLRLSQDKNCEVRARLGIPYNPYHPQPYERWTLKGLYDLDEGEILIGKDFWNFLACQDIYDDLLDLVEKIGKDLRPELNTFFERFQ